MKLTGSRCQCAACGLVFKSETGFNMHRIGAFGKDRRCASVPEMTDMGMSTNKGGLWITEKYDSTLHKAPKQMTLD